jgi:transposase
MIVIGVDTHKRSHTLVALDAATGATRGQLTIPASDDGTLQALRFAAELDSERVWCGRGLPARVRPAGARTARQR